MKFLMVKCCQGIRYKLLWCSSVQISGSSTASSAKMKELTRACGSATKKQSSPFGAAGVHQFLSTVDLDPEVSNLLRLNSTPNRTSWDISDSELAPNANRVVAVRIGVQVVERMVNRCHRRRRNGVKVGCALCHRTI
jgi:cytochrome c